MHGERFGIPAQGSLTLDIEILLPLLDYPVPGLYDTIASVRDAHYFLNCSAYYV